MPRCPILAEWWLKNMLKTCSLIAILAILYTAQSPISPGPNWLSWSVGHGWGAGGRANISRSVAGTAVWATDLACAVGDRLEITFQKWRFPKMGVPQMDDLQWKLLLKWMMKWGTSIYGNLQINFRHFSSMDWFKRSSAGKACFPPWKMKVSFPCVRPPRYLVALRWRSGIVSWWIVHINAI